MSKPRAFLSHSHEDSSVAMDLATRLMAQGLDVWVAPWAIRPGDSIIQKVFEEGLKDCSLFLVLLSPNSVSSAWVRHELDAALVQRIAGVTRVVPVVAQPCEIPVALRPFLRLDLSIDGIDGTVSRLVDVAFNRDRKPKLGQPPSDLHVSVGGLTNHASRLALLLASTMDQPDGRPLAASGADLERTLSMTTEQVNDAVDEIKSLGLARTIDWLGTRPYTFGQVEPTSALAFHLRGTDALSYDPEIDVRTVAATVVQLREVRGPKLQEVTSLPPSRLNRSVSYLEDYGIVQVRKFLGTAPYSFGAVIATPATRRFVADNTW